MAPSVRPILRWLTLSALCVLRLLPFARGTEASAATTGGLPSPVNQVFQWMQAGTQAWPDGSTTNAVAYLWIPEQCQRVRGLLILCTNVPEHRLVGDSSIRAACAAHDLGIVWCVPSFMNFRPGMPKQHGTIVGFLQQLLDGLARQSGYAEVATVPWLPIGESGHLLMVDALVEQAPERCIAGIWLKNNHLPPTNRTVPALVLFGTAQEWAQDKSDVRTKWNDVGAAYASVLEQRVRNPQWPLSYAIDGSSGHFDCSDAVIAFVAHYVERVAAARLPTTEGEPLHSIALDSGYVADLPVPGHEQRPPVPFAAAAPDARAVPWFFDRPSAEAAQRFAAINWRAETQLPAFADASGRVVPFEFNGISRLTPTMEADGVTFTLHPLLLDRIPANFVAAGAPLARSPVPPRIEWLCGPFQPLGGDRFQIALDRSWPAAACYLAARASGTPEVRASVQPCAIKLQKNEAGAAQQIAFPPIADVPEGTRSILLRAKASSGLPVRFFVRAGPATVDGDTLVLTPVPPRARRPVTVIVDAWQWGRAAAPAIQTAPVVEQSLKLLPR